MGVYVYCLGGGEAPIPGGLRGVGCAEVAMRPVAGFLAWVSELGRAPTPSLDEVRAHNRVVEAAASAFTPLPFRFGQWFESGAALEASLGDRRERLAATLQRVRGTQEFGVRVVDPAHVPEPPDRTSGRAYLESLARQGHHQEADRRRGEVIAEALHEWVGPYVRAERVHFPEGTGGLLALAHLVDRHDTGNYNDRVRAFSARQPALRFFFSGPWPPYGFVADEP